MNPQHMKHEEEHVGDTLAELAKAGNGEKDLEVAREKPVTVFFHVAEEQRGR